MKVLAIGAHPDDIEFGCGGTLIKFSERGHDVFLMVMTEGQAGAPGSTRNREQLISKEILGAKDVFWGGYEDTLLMVNKEVKAIQVMRLPIIYTSGLIELITAAKPR